MKKQITLTVLGAMLFTGSVFSTKAEEPTTSATETKVETTAAVVAPTAANSGAEATASAPVEPNASATTATNTTDAAASTKTDSSIATKTESWLNKLGSNLKTYKWHIAGGVAVIAGAYIAFKLYQAYNEEEVEQEVQLV